MRTSDDSDSAAEQLDNEGRRRALELFEEARAMITVGNLDDAVPRFNEALRADSNLAAAHYYLGVIALERNNNTDTIADFVQATRIEPDRSDFFNGLAAAYQAEGSLLSAEREFRRALELDKNNAEALRNLAALLEDLQRVAESLNVYTLLLANDPANQQTLAKVGELSRSPNLTISAQLLPDELANDRPIGTSGGARDQAQDLIWKARALIADGEPTEAAARLREALEVEDGLAAAHYYLGHVALQTSQQTDAISEFRRASELEPDRTEIFNGLGIALHRAGDLPAAERAFRQALDLSDDNSVAQNNLQNSLVNLLQILDNHQLFVDALSANCRLLAVIPDNQEALRREANLYSSISPHHQQPLRGDAIRVQLFDELLGGFPVTSMIETGTFLGVTTSHLAVSHPDLPIFTCEIEPGKFGFARRSLRSYRNVTVHNSSSPEFIASLLAADSLGSLPFFFLDAHWYDYWPLQDEIRLATSNCPRAIIVVDDFLVPGRPDFAFDSYDDAACDLALISPHMATTNHYDILYPSY